MGELLKLIEGRMTRDHPRLYDALRPVLQWRNISSHAHDPGHERWLPGDEEMTRVMQTIKSEGLFEMRKQPQQPPQPQPQPQPPARAQQYPQQNPRQPRRGAGGGPLPPPPQPLPQQQPAYSHRQPHHHHPPPRR